MATDQLQRFLFDNTAVRGEIAQLENAYQQVLAQNAYPAPIQTLLGELLAACALLTATVKLDGTLSIEIRGNGALRLLMAESSPGNHERAQNLRAVARFDETAELSAAPTLPELFGDGRVVITLDPREGKRYQGIVALEADTIAGCVETYFAQSEQLPTRLWLAANDTGAAGLLLQQLPRERDETGTDEDWSRLNHLAGTITEEELTGLETRDVLHRLFHEEDTRLFDPAPLAFSCSCSRERFGAALHQLGAKELRSVIAEQGQIETQCHFCNATYVFSPADVEALIDNPDAAPPTMH